jgi:hypothetical protein
LLLDFNRTTDQNVLILNDFYRWNFKYNQSDFMLWSRACIYLAAWRLQFNRVRSIPMYIGMSNDFYRPTKIASCAPGLRYNLLNNKYFRLWHLPTFFQYFAFPTSKITNLQVTFFCLIKVHFSWIRLPHIQIQSVGWQLFPLTMPLVHYVRVQSNHDQTPPPRNLREIWLLKK